MQFWIGILAAFGPPVLHGLSNILDRHLADTLFKRLTPLVFLSSCTGLFLLPVVFLIDAPQLVSTNLLTIAFLIAGIEVLYIYPYYWSLKHIDTSIVASLFSLGKVSVPLFAFVLVGEVLSPMQYVGFVLIILSSVTLTFDWKKLRFNQAFLLMLFVSMILAIQAVLFKFLFEQGVSWGTGVTWVTIFEFLIAFTLVIIPVNFGELKRSFKNVRKVGPVFILNELLGWVGNVTGYYAVFLIPVSIAKAIATTQPVFVLLFAFLISKKQPTLLLESLAPKDILKKIFLFLVLAAGVVVTIAG